MIDRNEQVSRILQIIQKMQLSRRGVTIAELAQLFDVNPKTIRRDLDAIFKAGFPVYDEKYEGRSYWKLIEGFFRMSVPFNASELMVLYFFRDLMSPLAGTGLDTPFRDLMHKVSANLPEEARHFCDSFESVLHARVGAHTQYSDRRAVLKSLFESARKKKTVRIVYDSYSSKTSSKRDLSPYSLHYHQGAFYVVGHDSKSKEVRVFHLDRIRLLQETGQTFKKPDGYKAADFFSGSFGIFKQDEVDVEIRFDQSVASFIKERLWHPSQQLTDVAGGVVLKMRVAGTREVKAWVMGFCEHAVVIEPEALRNEILNDLEKIAKAYQKSPKIKVAQ